MPRKDHLSKWHRGSGGLINFQCDKLQGPSDNEKSWPNEQNSKNKSGPCNSFYCLGHFNNVYDDDDEVDRDFWSLLT